MQEALYTTFENYLENEMSPEDKIEFERLLQDDKEVRKAFKHYKETTVFVAHKFSPATHDFKENLKTISKQHFNQTTAQKFRVISFKPWLYAVAACLLLFFGLQLFQGIAPSFEDYNQPEKAAFLERGDLDQNIKQAQESFNARKYKEAIVFFENSIKINPKPEFSYFYAIALLEENNIEKAEFEFTKLKNGNTIYKQNALWYLALSKLKQKEYQECKILLAQITAESDYYEKAKEILEQLN